MANSYPIGEFDPETLAEIPGNLSLTAMTGAGKTLLIIDWLSKIHKKFDSIYVFSRTAKIQKCYNFIPRENITDHFDEELLTKLFALHKSKKEANIDAELPKVLLIFDDVVNDLAYKRSKIFDNLFTEGRHYNFSSWFLTQKFTLLKPLQRVNVRWAVAFDLDTKKEREYFCQDYLSAHNNQVGEMLFKRIVKERKYQAVIVEIYKNGESVDQKVKKYVADPNVKAFKIKKNPPLIQFKFQGLEDLTLRTRIRTPTDDPEVEVVLRRARAKKTF
ncbi:hypothetical protein BASA81_008357 [Batrachochytrium salamandrivorans]|nr:hypothetical protein BASA81_008357 [Batrachochytrium salamandrivorans]